MSRPTRKQLTGKISANKQIQRVKLKLENTADRVCTRGQKQLEKEAFALMLLARKYAPHDRGNLDNADNWVVDKHRTGKNRRNVFTVRLRESKVVRKTKKGKPVRLRDYARIMHDDLRYRIRARSQRKARTLGLSISPTGSRGKYVGRLYLTRAGNHRRLAIYNNIKKQITKELR